MQGLKGQFISDSDNSAANQTKPAAERPNEYTLYQVDRYDIHQNTESVEIKDYTSETNPSYKTVVGLVTTLAPKAGAEPEKKGTKDATQNVNLVPESIQVLDSDDVAIKNAEINDVVTIEATVRNSSYAKLQENTTINWQVPVIRNGELIETKNLRATITNIEPNGTISLRADVKIDNPGEYEFGMILDALQDDAGNNIEEADYRDNSAKRYGSISVAAEGVKPKEEQPEKKESETAQTDETQVIAEEKEEEILPEKTDTATEIKEPLETEKQMMSAEAAKQGDEQVVQTPAVPTVKASTASKVYRLLVDLNDEESFVLQLNGKEIKIAKQYKLKNRNTGEVVDKELYLVSKADKGYEMTFSREFLESLLPGENNFVLTSTKGKILIQIVIL